MKKIDRTTAVMFFSLILLISFNNCSVGQNSQQEQLVAALACDQVADSLRTPNSIVEAINLMNALPKPLTMDCFLKSLKKPLKVMAVNNTFSAQPAMGNENPRIFILNSKLSISVVPAGIGKALVEMSEPTSSTMSSKAELEFPIQQKIAPYEAFNRIADGSSDNSKCVFCHRFEEKKLYPGIGFVFNSGIVRPNEYQRVFSKYLRNQASICDSTANKDRCDILNAIFMMGEAQDSDFPF